MSGCWRCLEITDRLRTWINVNPVFESVIYTISHDIYIYPHCSHLISWPSKAIKANMCVHTGRRRTLRDCVSANDGTICTYIYNLYIKWVYTHSIRRTTERERDIVWYEDQKSFVTNCHNNRRWGFNYPFRSCSAQPANPTGRPSEYTPLRSNNAINRPLRVTVGGGCLLRATSPWPVPTESVNPSAVGACDCVRDERRKKESERDKTYMRERYKQ